VNVPALFFEISGRLFSEKPFPESGAKETMIHLHRFAVVCTGLHLK
jgi:hypothetical protein